MKNYLVFDVLSTKIWSWCDKFLMPTLSSNVTCVTEHWNYDGSTVKNSLIKLEGILSAWTERQICSDLRWLWHLLKIFVSEAWKQIHYPVQGGKLNPLPQPWGRQPAGENVYESSALWFSIRLSICVSITDSLNSDWDSQWEWAQMQDQQVQVTHHWGDYTCGGFPILGHGRKALQWWLPFLRFSITILYLNSIWVIHISAEKIVCLYHI